MEVGVECSFICYVNKRETTIAKRSSCQKGKERNAEVIVSSKIKLITAEKGLKNFEKNQWLLWFGIPPKTLKIECLRAKWLCRTNCVFPVKNEKLETLIGVFQESHNW